MDALSAIKKLNETMTQRELAIALKVSEVTIDRWVDGVTQEVKPENAEKILALAKKEKVI